LLSTAVVAVDMEVAAAVERTPADSEAAVTAADLEVVAAVADLEAVATAAGLQAAVIAVGLPVDSAVAVQLASRVDTLW
jgi:hypothetical protein